MNIRQKETRSKCSLKIQSDRLFEVSERQHLVKIFVETGSSPYNLSIVRDKNCLVAMDFNFLSDRKFKGLIFIH